MLIVDLLMLLQLGLGECLDGLDERNIVGGHQGEGSTAPSGPGCPADAMHVVLAHRRHIVVNDKVDGGDVQTSRRHVSGNKDANL